MEAVKTYHSQDRILESLLKISQETHNVENIGDFIAIVHEILSDLITARNFFIALYNEASGKYFFPYFEDEYDKLEVVALSSVYNELEEAAMYEMPNSLTDYVRRHEAPLRFSENTRVQLFEGDDINYVGTPSLSFLGVPLKLSGKTKGVMAVHDYHIKDAFSEKDEELMVFASEHIAQAIEHVRAEEKIRKQHLLVLEQKQAITDSIHYASRIQQAVLPSEAYMGQVLPEHFIMYRPKDLISGDFYWVQDMDPFKVVIVADCTGHGVPGAMMSMLGAALLAEHFKTFGVGEPDVILGYLREKVKAILAREGSEDVQKDGMEMAIILFNEERQEVHFSGANRPLYLFRKSGQECIMGLSPFMETKDHELYIFKGDPQPIGAHWEENPFTRYSIKLQENDTLYLFSDGFVDQFGGTDRKRFKIRYFRELLLSVQGESMKVQKAMIEEAFNNWIGKQEQIDDVTVMGLRVNFSNTVGDQ